jgi:hypothetical protein
VYCNTSDLHHMTPWRKGSASDSSPEGCAFKSRRGQRLIHFHEVDELCFILQRNVFFRLFKGMGNNILPELEVHSASVLMFHGS